MSVPVEIARREDQIEVRARERYIREKAEFNTKVAARQAKEAETGKKTGGKNPAPVILLADTGYFSEQNVKACIGAEVEPLISIGRDAHHPGWRERFSEPAPLSANATPVEKMKHTLKTRAGKAIYALRKQTVEPVFGIIKQVMGFRQFMLRGLENVGHEWTLVCLAWNLKRMAVLRQNCVKIG